MRSITLSLFSIVLFCWPVYANAHVKWFANYDLLCPPRSTFEIAFGPYFLTAYTDQLLVCRSGRLFRKVQSLSENYQAHVGTTLRYGVSIFFFAAASYGAVSDEGFILTPELKTSVRWMAMCHMTIAMVALFSRTAFLAGIGIAALYAHAANVFGVYHLLDYPIFIGVACYLIIDSLWGKQYSVINQIVLRLFSGITLLWAAIEKFAYPEWSYELLSKKPDLMFGFDAEFYMVAAGFVEFCAAYLLIFGVLSARVAAMVLLFFFVSAIYHFGVVDAIGHAVIIVVLIILTLSHNPLAEKFHGRGQTTTAVVHTGLFFAAVFLFMEMYNVGHDLSYQPFTAGVS